MRIIFMGTPSFAVPTLEALVAAGHEVVAVYTQPPRPGGRRGNELTPTPVHQAAEKLGLEVRCPTKLRDLAAEADFAACDADVAVVAAYGLILPQLILDTPKHGCLNVHASLLPRWRGAAPVQRAILAGDSMTGVTIMRMEAGLDTGPMLAKASTPVESKTAGELTEELGEIGAHLMVEVLANPAIHPGEAQNELESSYAKKIDKAETRIDFARDAEFIERQTRAFAPAPGAWFEFEGERYRILSAHAIGLEGYPATVLDERLTIACGHGAIRPLRIQRAGKPAMDTADLLRGKPIPPGTVIR
ncbi:MAG: methionyl-tRNA formyltransferase [Novosphingobium sp.]|nr:methionyl-tRNA formyltransferase [Novosphingobium sp.]